jgi:hypothetical protein
VASDPSVKLAVQRHARGLEAAVNAGDAGRWRADFAADFAGRDEELGPLLERTERAELIGTVANRTLLHLHLDGGDTRVVELLWAGAEDAYTVQDARVFSLLPGE